MDSIGKYDVLGPLGRGGMGVVYRARDPVIGREVAVKMIVDRAVEDPDVRRRFLAEAQRAGGLSHPHIVTIHDVGEDDGRPFIVMELLDGTDLRRVLDGDRDLGLAERIRVAVQAAHGLAHAHERGVLHRDVKPENVFVTAAGTAKVLDFGIARVESDADTVTQAAIGTPRYMSPEQIRGEAVDRRTDVYSFGVLLYELIGGAPPFEGGRVHSLMHRILTEDPPPLPLPDGAPPALAAVVARCLAKAPADRFPGLDAVADALEAAMAGEAVPAAPRSRRVPVLAAGAVAVLAVVGLLWWAAADAPDADSPADVAAVAVAASEPEPAESLAVAVEAAPPGAPPVAAPAPVPVASAPVPIASPPPARSAPSMPPPQVAAAAPPPPAVDPAADRRAAGAALDRLARRLAAAMQARDAAALRSVHPFYGAMGPLFEIAEDVQATATPSGLAVSGDRATAAVDLSFSFANTTRDRRRETQRVGYAWTLARSGGEWALVEVAAR